jgi:hypothetical protein
MIQGGFSGRLKFELFFILGKANYLQLYFRAWTDKGSPGYALGKLHISDYLVYFLIIDFRLYLRFLLTGKSSILCFFFFKASFVKLIKRQTQK